jgi:hypothetical protein
MIAQTSGEGVIPGRRRRKVEPVSRDADRRNTNGVLNRFIKTNPSPSRLVSRHHRGSCRPAVTAIAAACVLERSRGLQKPVPLGRRRRRGHAFLRRLVHVLDDGKRASV